VALGLSQLNLARAAALLPLGFLLISKKMVDDGGLFLLPSM